MKRRTRGMISLTMAAAMLLAGCGSASSTSGDSSASTRNEDGKYDPVITINIGKQLDENAGYYDDGDDINNNPMTRLTEESLGIVMNTVLLGGDSSNYDTKLRLALTGSEALPDVFPVYSTTMIADMIESGQVKAIDEDIELYMSDRLKEIYDEYPTTFYPVTSDGKVYGIACSPHLTEGQVMIIRQDWLDNLGLEAPATIEEFEEVIRAFTEDDPDGNGKDDTYGFTYSGIDSYNTGWVSDTAPIFSVFSGTHFPGSWQEDEDGNLVYGSIDEGNKEALELMAKWHANGWIFQEAAATGAWDAMTQFTEGKAGIFIGRPWCINSVADVTSVDPDAVVKGYPLLKQTNGEDTCQSAEINDGWLMFSADFDNMEAFFVYLDWLYDKVYGTGDFQYGYIQEYDYDIVDGEVVFDSEQFDPPKSDVFMVGKSTVMKNEPALDTMQIYADIAAGKEPETAQEMSAQASFETAPDMCEAYVLANDYRDNQLPDLFNTAPTETMSKKWLV